jgi:hypothetical protein
MKLGKRIRRRTALLGLVALSTAIAWVMVAASWLETPVFAQKDGNVPAIQVPFELPLEQPAKASDLLVHEWGTFLGMSSADGTALDGMYHEEHALPAFVHGRSKDQLKLPFMLLKGETPVIYFYTKETQKVRVGVGFPRGVWTQWYPQAAMVQPSLLTQAEQSGELKNGRICWYAEVIPAWAMPRLVSKGPSAVSEMVNVLPETKSDALWNHARQVDAAFVKVIDGARSESNVEYERFLFYRGLGESRLPMRIEETGQGTLTLDSEASLGEGVRDVFVLRVESGRGAFTYRPALRPGEAVGGVIPSMSEAVPLAEFTQKIGDELTARLSESGLFAKEARAMVNTWANSYFQTEGIRVLFVLPQSWTDAFIPMTIDPQPRKIVRVMVGRLEMLSTARQRSAEAAIGNLASADQDERGRAYRLLREQGRYVEPIVRHVLKTTKDDQVRSLCQRLLMTDFVTDLRAAIHNAADGKRLNADPVLLRAQLARLLRQAGQDTAARAEAKSALEALASYPVLPGQKLEDSTIVTEIRASALEGMGEDLRAAEAYARRIEFLARGLGNFEDAQIPGLRDWWVGRAYAQCVMKSGQSAAVESELRDKVAKSSPRGSGIAVERAPRMLLAFLLDQQGKESLALSAWRSMLTPPASAAAVASPYAKAEPDTKSGT